MVIKGNVRIHFTDNEADVAKGENGHVLAKVAIQRTGELDAEIIALINSGKAKEAIAVTEKELVRIPIHTTATPDRVPMLTAICDLV
jgi:hypothetical protein